MSHFDDIDFLFWVDSPKTGCGAIVFIAVAIVAIVWACSADEKSRNICVDNGERYVDSRSEYTLCERSDGTVVRR